MRTSARWYAWSILVLFLLELLGPRFVAARPRALNDDDTTTKSRTVRKDAAKSANAGLTELERMLFGLTIDGGKIHNPRRYLVRPREATRARSDHWFPAGLLSFVSKVWSSNYFAPHSL
jgi:hypothetical protein